MAEDQDPYQAKIKDLKDQISELGRLQAANEVGSPNHRVLRQRAEELTTEMLEWERAAPILADLDALIEDAESRVRREDRRLLNAVGAWHRVAWWCGGLGALLLLICWWWAPTAWLPVIAILLLLGAAVCGWQARHTQNLLGERVTAAQATVMNLGAERRRHLPTGGVRGSGGVGETTRVDVPAVKVHPGGAGADGVGDPFGGGDTRRLSRPLGESDNVRG